MLMFDFHLSFVITFCMCIAPQYQRQPAYFPNQEPGVMNWQQCLLRLSVLGAHAISHMQNAKPPRDWAHSMEHEN